MHLTEKPKFMQPKTNKCNNFVENFIVSPRKIIRKALISNEGFPYADCFNMDYKLTLEQYDDAATGRPKTHMKAEFRVNMLKTVRFLQSTIIKETEASLKDAYGYKYKDDLIAKILELKSAHKELWERSSLQ